jgi:DNA-3-methyladenine glycosylase
MEYSALKPSFFSQSTLDLAQSLLGKTLVHETIDGLLSGWIVETEAYMGPLDRAAHSFGNRRTPRTEVMYGPPGFAYTYVMHTHCLLNVVSGQEGQPEAVLIRAIEPIGGIEKMRQHRGQLKRMQDLTNGPGKLTKAFAISMHYYGCALWTPPLYFAEGRTITQLSTGPRIGIENSGEAKHYPWRFWEAGNPFVSK